MEKELKKINDRLDFIINNYSVGRNLKDEEHKVKNKKFKTLINNIYKKLIDLYFLVDETNQNSYEGVVDKFILVYINLLKINIVNTPTKNDYVYFIGLPIDIKRGESKLKIITHNYKDNELVERFINNNYLNIVYSRILLFNTSINELIYRDKNLVLLYWVKGYVASYRTLSTLIDFSYNTVVLSDNELINFKKLNII
jgi:hypothetical protein